MFDLEKIANRWRLTITYAFGPRVYWFSQRDAAEEFLEMVMFS